MDNVGRMKEFYGAQEVVKDHTNVLLGKSEVSWFLIFEHAPQVLSMIIHNQKYVLKIILVIWNNHVIQMSREYVLLHFTQILHDLNFSHHLFELVSWAENIRYPFYGHYLLSFEVASLKHAAKGSLTDLTKYFVVFSDGWEFI